MIKLIYNFINSHSSTKYLKVSKSHFRFIILSFDLLNNIATVLRLFLYIMDN